MKGRKAKAARQERAFWSALERKRQARRDRMYLNAITGRWPTKGLV